MRKINVGNDFHVAWEIKEQGVLVDLMQVEDSIQVFAKVGDCSFEIPKALIEVLPNGLLRIEIKTELFQKVGRYEFYLKYWHHDTSMSDDNRKRQTNFTPFAIVPKTELADAVDDIAVTSDILIGLKGDSGKSAYLYYKENTTDNPILTEQEFANKLAVIPSNEDDRISAESTRVSNESERASSESQRKNNETTRKASEVTRNDNEVIRESNEVTRKLNEVDRVNAESDRVDAEITREQQEQARQTNTATAIDNANSAADSTNIKGNYAQAQGDYAKEQGDAVEGRVSSINSNTLTIEEVTAQAIVAIQNRIIALEKILSEGLLDKIKIMNLDIIDNFNVWGQSNLILTGTSAPSVIPDFIGQTFIDTTNKVAYTATGNHSVLDWK